uniref:non-specific serine/threonine protein kinase n=1 Tax=Leptobrachium leishanense TaxID=445787 RepID=A0A8C5M804_9ANUR
MVELARVNNPSSVLYPVPQLIVYDAVSLLMQNFFFIKPKNGEKVKTLDGNKAGIMRLVVVMAAVLDEDKNCRGLLTTYCLRNTLTLKFEPAKQEGPSHNPTFTSYVYVNNELVGEGCAAKKKTAENLAAKMALTTLENREPQALPPVNPQAPQASQPVAAAREEPLGSGSGTSPNNVQRVNYVGQMNELCSKFNLLGTFLDVNRSGPHHDPKFYLRAKIDATSYPVASGKNRKLAKQRAAFLALVQLKETYPEELQNVCPGADIEELGSDNSSFSGSTAGRSSERRSLENGATSLSSDGISFRSSSTMIPSSPSSVKSNGPLDGYEDITVLGAGSFGKVFKATYILDGICCAVKQIKLKDNCSEAGGTQKWLFIRMELCEHGNLKKWIGKKEKVEKHKSLDIFRQLVDGVAFIHLNKLIHRDIKPANILFASETDIKISDFGLVTEMTGENENQALQRTQGTGTPSYMAPEQRNDKYENEVDIFPLGLILFELLCIFGSYHEKQREWVNIRQGELPVAFKKQNPYEETMIREMLSEDPKKRPTASKLKELFVKVQLMDSRTY